MLSLSDLRNYLLNMGIPDVLWTKNRPQCASTDFVTSWYFKHVTCSPHHPALHWFTQSVVNISKTALSKVKYRGKDQQLSFMVLCSMQVNVNLLLLIQLLTNVHWSQPFQQCVEHRFWCWGPLRQPDSLLSHIKTNALSPSFHYMLHRWFWYLTCRETSDAQYIPQ